jgi:uncharacterized lipoprotein YajG
MKHNFIKIALMLIASTIGLTACESKSTDASKENTATSQTQTKSASEKVYDQLDGKDNGRLKP